MVSALYWAAAIGIVGLAAWLSAAELWSLACAVSHGIARVLGWLSRVAEPDPADTPVDVRRFRGRA